MTFTTPGQKTRVDGYRQGRQDARQTIERDVSGYPDVYQVGYDQGRKDAAFFEHERASR